MAQEDNNLNARMAVSSSRDSSSMKALAVITAIFLPGEFMSSLFGMGIFDWQSGDESGVGDDSDKDPVVGYDFWVYWAITIPLTILILVLWRAWWVGQDRYFRKHLSKELSEERYWTDDRRPRKLETSFLYDFLFMSVRRGEASVEHNGAGRGTIGAAMSHHGPGHNKMFGFQRSSTSGSNNTLSTHGAQDELGGGIGGLRWFGGRDRTKQEQDSAGLPVSPLSPTFRLRQMAFEGRASPSTRRHMDNDGLHTV